MPRRVADRFRTAFVTGAAEGLGRAMAEMLVGEGVKVWATSRDLSRLEPLVQAGGGQVIPLALDLSDPAGCVAAFRSASDQAGGTIDVLVNNGGYGIFGEFGSVPGEQWTRQLAAMLGGTLALTHAAWNAWGTTHRGMLVNVSSLAAEFPIPFMSGYNAAKSGLSALTGSLMFETRGRAVSVIDFRPGDYRTGFNRSMHHRSAPGDSFVGPPAAVWKTIDATLNAAPSPARAARDLRRALLRGKNGIVRSGTFFQARLAPLLASLAPSGLQRAVTARYFGLR